jgi:carbamoylphosphate synthase large subunit
MNKHALICIAAGSSQIPVIKAAKEEGLKVIAVDQNMYAPGLKYADETIIQSTYNADLIIRELYKYGDKYNFKGVITRSSGIPVITVAEIADEFGLPGVNPSTAINIVYKDKLMNECEKLMIPAPKHQKVTSVKEINWKILKYPIVIKPSLGLIGKSGVIKVSNKQDLMTEFDITKRTSYNGIVDIQGYESGHDIILMGFSINGKLHPVILIDEINYFDKHGNVEMVGLRVPSIVSESKYEIYNFAQDVIQKLNINTSPFLMSCKYQGENLIKLIEIHLDLGGDRILEDLLPMSSDVDFIKLVIMAVTQNYAEDSNYDFAPILMIRKDKKEYYKKEYGASKDVEVRWIDKF